jgi:hypothetical protein
LNNESKSLNKTTHSSERSYKRRTSGSKNSKHIFTNTRIRILHPASDGQGPAADATALRRLVDDLLVNTTQHNRSATELRLQKQLAENAL